MVNGFVADRPDHLGEPTVEREVESGKIVLTLMTTGNDAGGAAAWRMREEPEGTCAIVMVPHLNEARERLRPHGANILQGTGALLMGRRLFAETPDRALTTEWVEHRPRQGGRLGPG